ncbi:MAG: biotin--[acetyl-CoA-carboxylase] ligase [Stappiaceae bacterium]
MSHHDEGIIDGPNASYRWRALSSVSSTNAACLTAGRKNSDTRNLWITADRQTAGKGRRGRSWESPPGNLYASVLLVNPALKTSSIGELPLLAAVALAEALEFVTGTHALSSLKWPNDCLVDGAKISGILLESELQDAGNSIVVVGFGVNCVSHPDSALYPTTDLAALGYRVDSRALFQALAKTLDRWLGIWDRGNNFSDVRTAWISRAVGIGKPITVRLPDQEIQGRFLDLDANGYLVLEEIGGATRLISAGDVFLSNTL